MTLEVLRRLLREHPKPEELQGDVTCLSCGYKGSVAEFMEADAADSICPLCGERNEHRYEV